MSILAIPLTGLAWGLYSPGNSRVEVFVSDGASERMDADLQSYFFDSADMYGSQQFSMDRWSLDALGVPIYPQGRFQKAAAIRWLRRQEILDQATLIEYGPSHPVSGRRTSSAVKLPNQ